MSAGAKIAMDSGTENMDWISRVLRAIIEFTQDGGEINVVVTGINVGAQPYWNAEATMLMHTKGILVMTPDSAMVLTGKQSLDYSGGVSAEDNFGIGGYDRIMGPNGQAQYWAPDLSARPWTSCSPTTRTPTARPASGSRGPRRRPTRSTATSRDSPHAGPGTDFATRRARSSTDEPRPQEAVRHPLDHARRRRRRPRDRWSAGWTWSTPRASSSSTRTSAGSRC